MARYIACMALVAAPGVLAQGPGGASGCDMAQALPITMACANNIDPTDATFCASQCYRALAPFVANCQTSMPSYVQIMLATPLSLISHCRAPPPPPPPTPGAGGGPSPTPAASCSIISIGSICAAHPPPNVTSLSASFCAQPCIAAIVPCANDPQLQSLLLRNDPTKIAQTQQLATACNTINAGGTVSPSTGAGADFSGAGNGLCEINSASIASCSTLGPADYSGPNACTLPCVQEAIDCIDDPLMAPHHDDIAGLQTLCAASGAQCQNMLMSLSNVVEETCCQLEPGHHCTSVPTHPCQLPCAKAFMPVWNQCQATIIGAMPGTTAAQWSAFAAGCPAIGH